MALLFAEDTLTFYPVTEDTDADGVVQIPEEGSGEEVTGQLYSMTSQAAFDKYGVELKRPSEFLYNETDEAKVSYPYKATYGSRIFEVADPPIPHKPGGAFADMHYLEVVLEEREYT
jgi:hypothetical protein